MKPYRLHLHSDHELTPEAAEELAAVLERARRHTPRVQLYVTHRVTGPESWCVEVRRLVEADTYTHSTNRWWSEGEPDALIYWGERPAGLERVPAVALGVTP